MRTSIWDDETRIKLLTELWVSGKSAGYIANELSKDGIQISRNAVVGKVNRLALTRKAKASRPNRSVTLKRRPRNGSKRSITISSRAPRKAAVIKPHQMEDEVRVPNPKHRIHLISTRDFHCRAIVDYEDGQKAKAICCGEITPWIVSSGMKRRSSWCQYHRKLYLTLPKQR